MKVFAVLLTLATLIPQSLSAQIGGSPKQAVVHAGIDEGGLVLGGDFLVNDTPTESYGAYLRIFSKDEDRGAPALSLRSAPQHVGM